MSLGVALGYPIMVCSQFFGVYAYIHVMCMRLYRSARKSTNPIPRNISCSYANA